MSAPYPCPCNCGQQFSTENGAVMHAINMGDEEHDAVTSKTDGYDRLDGGNDGDESREPADESGGQETTPGTDESDGAADGAQASDGSNPAFDGPSPDTSTSAASGSVELPCGDESYDPADAPNPPFKVSCGACGKSWRVTDE